MMLSRRFRTVVARPATAAMLTLGLLAVAPQFRSPVSVKADAADCTTSVTSAPTGAATVSTKSTPFGTVLSVGSGAFAGCSLYVLTSDELHSLTFGLAAFACSNGANPIGQPCNSVLWPALLTKGAPSPDPASRPRSSAP